MKGKGGGLRVETVRRRFGLAGPLRAKTFGGFAVPARALAADAPACAARSRGNVSDGSSVMVRGNLNMSASSEFRTARLRIIPSRLDERIHQTSPLRRPAAGWRGDHEVAAQVDPSALAGLSAGKPGQRIPRDPLKTVLSPQAEGG